MFNFLHIRKGIIFNHKYKHTDRRYIVVDYYRDFVFLVSLSNNILPIRFVKIISYSRLNKYYEEW